ncbi:MAG: MFS transporter [Chitinispirillaceae bacterium]
MKKWTVLIAGVLLQTALGGIYAWSTFVPHFVNTYGFSKAQCGMIFGVMVASFTVATIPAGRVLMKLGPRITAGIGSVLFAGGYLIASFSQGSYVVIMAGLGLTAGAGIGFGYVCPLTVGMKWFPKNKGFVTGVAVAGFGMGAVLLSTVADKLLETMNILTVLRIVGLGLGGMAFFSSMFMSEPPETSRSGVTGKAKEPLAPYLFSSKFLLMCLGMFAGTFAGLLISGNLKPLKMSLGLTDQHATFTISLFAIGNTIGRLAWGQVHDRLGSRKTILLSLGALFFSILPLLFMNQLTALFSATVLIGFGFGACFVVYASSVVESFGVHFLPRLYPICFLGYGIAALIGPATGGWIADFSGSYFYALIMSAGIVFLAFAWIYFGFRGPKETSSVTEETAGKGTAAVRS